MSITPNTFQEKLDDVLQSSMRYETLGATSRATVTQKTIDVLQDLNKPGSFDNYIDVMQQYIDLAHTILSEGVDKPIAMFAGQDGWVKEIDRLYLHFKGFIDNIKKLAGNWMGSNYRKNQYVDFLEPLKELPVQTRVVYMMAGDNTPEWLFPLFEYLKSRLIFMTENNKKDNEYENARNVWMVCTILQDRAIFIADKLIDVMEKIVVKHKTVVSINLKEIIARANASPSAPSEPDPAAGDAGRGGRRTRRHKRSGHKKRSGKRSDHKKRSGKRSDKSRRR